MNKILTKWEIWDCQLRRDRCLVPNPPAVPAKRHDALQGGYRRSYRYFKTIDVDLASAGIPRSGGFAHRHSHGRERTAVPGRTWVYGRYSCSQGDQFESERLTIERLPAEE
jgi:hypothetical protein